MLYAFNQKNVRRVLTAGQPNDHVNDRNEDGVTSMVFSPLAFMPAMSAAAILLDIVGTPLIDAFTGRSPHGHNIVFWPGLSAVGRTGRGTTRCEPDFLACFSFQRGPPVIVVSEVKWDMPVTAAELGDQMARQRHAVAAAYPGAKLDQLTITKHRLALAPTAGVARTWVNVQRSAAALSAQAPSSPHGRCSALVAPFLDAADQAAFQGFRAVVPVLNAPPTIFWADA